MDPADLLARHGLPTDGLEPIPGGLVNHVWRTERHVVRIGPNSDHPREARLADAARAIGVATPPAVAAGQGYSIWERWRGNPPTDVAAVPTSTWNALLDDLARIHAQPLEPSPETPLAPFRPHHELVEQTHRAAGWTREEREVLHALLGRSWPIRRPTFIHGDAFASNLLVDSRGGYLGIIDWGCARWSALEEECCRLEDPALALALERWGRDLDIGLMWTMRLDLLLLVASFGRTSYDRVRPVLRLAAAERA